MSQNEPTILVIDDEVGILDTLKILLKNSGFTVETAQGGKAGLEALNNLFPDIVLTDVRMPQVGGIEILGRAHKISGGDAEVADRWNDAQVQMLRQKLAQKEEELGENPSEDEKQDLEKLRQEFNAKDVEVRKGRCERYPNNLNYRYDLAVRYQAVGKYNEAIGEFQKARNDNKRVGVCMLALGQCFQQIKQYRLAMSHYEEAVREIPDGDADHKKQALYLTAKLAFGMKDYDAAENYATTLGAIDFSYKDVPALLDKIAQKREDGDEPA